ncbi:RDD family protein [Solitalea lacus]|uniref:RDD family protein n=1 Tax=Solitalea lacus TaxID=2911172 RepID=UPI001EDB7423|nr:RDD family protein [Solitalea lacus]UKJ06266.1 RDD family protein [Solitalea lacus]
MNEVLENSEKQSGAGELHIVPSYTRFINYVIDYLFLSTAMSFFMPNAELDFNKYQTIQDFLSDPIFIKFSIINFAVTLLYYLVCESVFGQTVGKFVTRTHVVDDYGNKPGFLRILARTLCRAIPLEALSFLFTPIGWHDSISKTYVVRKQPSLISQR